MSLQSALEAQLPFLREQAESRMTSRCTVRRPGGEPVVVDGIETPGWVVVHTDLHCRLGGSERGGAGTRTVTVGQSEVQVAVRVLHIPATTSGVTDGDLVEIVSGENAGAVLRVVESSWQDQATARRLPMLEVQRPEEWA